MGKIGILTFHYANNYGAFLQCFALQEWLKENTEYEIEVIDYRPIFQIRPYKISLEKALKDKKGLSKLKALLLFLVELPNKIKKQKNFNSARKFLSLSKDVFYDNHFDLKDNYDYLLLGSDQIWNPVVTYGFDNAYFGENSYDSTVKIAYAASCGVEFYSDEEQRVLSQLLGNVDYIGVREQASIDLLSPLTEKNVIVNADPTLLVNPSFWHNYIHPVNENNFILVYQLGNNLKLLEDAKSLAKKTGKKILYFRDPSIKKEDFTSVSFSGPFEFISYIYSADVVLTDSFHATCFSVIFGKNFYTYLNPKRSERLRSLARIGQFEDRLIEYGERVCFKKDYNKNYIDNLTALRLDSENYLKSIIE